MNSKPDRALRVHVCIATGGSPRPEFMMSLAAAVAYFVAHRLPGVDEQTIAFNMSSNCIVNVAREMLAKDALERGATHLLLLDDDMEFPPAAFCRLASHELAIVGSNYRMKKRVREFVSCAEDGATRVPTNEDSTGLERVRFIGFGLCLIERRVFEDLERPWFPVPWAEDRQDFVGEDVMFCLRAANAGYESYIDHDLTKTVAHIGGYRYTWNSTP